MAPVLNQCLFLLLASLFLLKLSHASPAPQQNAPAGFKYPSPKDAPPPKKQRLPPGRTARLLLYSADEEKRYPVGCLGPDGKAFIPGGWGGLGRCPFFDFQPTGWYKDYRRGSLTLSRGGSCEIASGSRELLCRPGYVKLPTGPGELFSRPDSMQWGYYADDNPDNGVDGESGDLQLVKYWNADGEPARGTAITLFALPKGVSDQGRDKKYILKWS